MHQSGFWMLTGEDASNGFMPALVSAVAVAILRVQALHAKLLLEGRKHQQGSECVTVCTY